MPNQITAAFCCNCREDFPLGDPNSGYRMGEMQPLSRAPRRLVDRFRSWLDHPDGHYLCGNCYFDLTDDD